MMLSIFRPPVVRGTKLAIVAATGLAFVACDRDSGRSPSTQPLNRQHSGEAARSRLAAQSHDAGEVLAGQTVVHGFMFSNPDNVELQLDSDKDIQSSCGCTKVRVADHTLAPQGQTKVTLEIATQSKRGPVEEYARVKWSRRDGTPLETRFTLRANVQAALTWDPPQLHFSQHDIVNQVTKPITCRTDLDLNLLHAALTTNDEQLRLQHIQVDSRQRTVTANVSCTECDTGDAKVAWIRIDAPSQPVSAARAPSESSQAINRVTPQESMEYSAVLPVYIDDLQSLRVAPRFPALQAETIAGETQWTGQLVVSGSAIQKGDTVEDLTCESCSVKFVARPLGHAAIKIQLQATPIDLPVTGQSREVHTGELIMSSGKRLPVRFRMGAPPAPA